MCAGVFQFLRDLMISTQLSCRHEKLSITVSTVGAHMAVLQGLLFDKYTLSNFGEIEDIPKCKSKNFLGDWDCLSM